MSATTLLIICVSRFGWQYVFKQRRPLRNATGQRNKFACTTHIKALSLGGLGEAQRLFNIARKTNQYASATRSRVPAKLKCR